MGIEQSPTVDFPRRLAAKPFVDSQPPEEGHVEDDAEDCTQHSIPRTIHQHSAATSMPLIASSASRSSELQLKHMDGETCFRVGD